MAQDGARSADSADDGPRNADWNWHPNLPIEIGLPWFTLNPRKGARWVFQNYMQLSDRSLILVYSLVVAFWLQPVSSTQAVMSVDWVAYLLVRNYLVFTLLAMVLHRWFYGVDGQGNIQRYAKRPYIKGRNALFNFNEQIKDNVYYSLAFGVPIATGFEILSRMAYANGLFREISFSSDPVWYILMFPIVATWQTFHFYWIHRLLHWPPLYKHVHAVHHRNVNPGPWSGLSMHPVEHLLYFTTPMIFFVLPSDPAHMIFLLNWQLLGVVTDHSGYASIWIKDKARIQMASFFHQLHHRYYECNYGGGEVPWDKWLGTMHDGTDEGTRQARARKKAGKF